jgi:hypothetical protein
MVWGTDCGAHCDSVVWSAHDINADNIVWGTAGDDNIVWGTAGDHNIVWGTSFNVDNIVWGTSLDDNIVWGTDCGGADCDNIVWGTVDLIDNIVWGTALASDNIVWGTSFDDNIVWGTSVGDSASWASSTDGGAVFADGTVEPLPDVSLEFIDITPADPTLSVVPGVL